MHYIYNIYNSSLKNIHLLNTQIHSNMNHVVKNKIKIKNIIMSEQIIKSNIKLVERDKMDTHKY